MRPDAVAHSLEFGLSKSPTESQVDRGEDVKTAVIVFVSAAS
jgi:hypothetical protein